MTDLLNYNNTVGKKDMKIINFFILFYATKHNSLSTAHIQIPWIGKGNIFPPFPIGIKIEAECIGAPLASLVGVTKREMHRKEAGDIESYGNLSRSGEVIAPDAGIYRKKTEVDVSP